MALASTIYHWCRFASEDEVSNGAADASLFVQFRRITVHQYVEGGNQVTQVRFKPTPDDVSFPLAVSHVRYHGTGGCHYHPRVPRPRRHSFTLAVVSVGPPPPTVKDRRCDEVGRLARWGHCWPQPERLFPSAGEVFRQILRMSCDRSGCPSQPAACSAPAAWTTIHNWSPCRAGTAHTGTPQ